ncbi:hypothetical protein [Spiroplasma endosymbiont of Polydrusus pterygomalis]|uniref:hypothetical protein n=1 Tax=Spiroplasma endosymbiont of Polydrusus pterygomalis TaxID=3139327 RepID=UPI003CCAD751
MTTNYKTSFLLPHDYEIPTFNYPEYVLPPVPYNYKTYTKDIMPAGVVQPLKTKITATPKCQLAPSPNGDVNLFDNTTEYKGYYGVEIDLKQIDPTIKNISKFQDAYKTIEISNLANLQVECGPCDIENFIPNRDVKLLTGYTNCNKTICLLEDLNLLESNYSQTDKVNFPNTFTIDTKEITNDIKTIDTFKTNGLPEKYYENTYEPKNKPPLGLWKIYFLLQITKLYNNDNDKIKETYLQAYYTNDVKLKIRFSKVLIAKLIGRPNTKINFGNDKEIVIDVSNPNVLGIRNKSINPVKITIKPR